MIEVEHVAHSRAPREAVWALIADQGGWHEWGPWSEIRIHDDVRELVSERKRPNGKHYVMTERTTAMAAPERFEYDLLKGLPLRDYHGTVTLTDADGGGTDIRWQARFKPTWPFLGRLWRGGMTKVVRDVSERLADAAAAGSRS